MVQLLIKATFTAPIYSNKIMSCNINGGHVKVHTVMQLQGPGHRRVTIVRDEVMISEVGNNGTIMVHDRELNYMRQLLTEL